MKHIKYFQEFINESVSDIESIYQKYYSDIDRGIYDKIVEADPTTVMKDNKQGVYVKWMIKLFKNNKLKLEDLYKATEYLTTFNMFKHKIVNKDIMFYQSLPDLFKVVEPFLEKEETVFANDEERRLAGQFKVVYTDDEYRIIIPLTLNASKYFGRDTEWCTLNTDMFKHYTKKQSDDITPYNLYILYTDNLKDRLQFHFKEKQFMDIKDKEINYIYFFEKHKDIYNFFNKYLKVDRYIKDLSIKWSRNTFDGAPEVVEGYFNCSHNQLTSLEGAPKTVEGNFYCSNNQLTSLEGAPKTVEGVFYCSNNQLTSLEGAPKTVEGVFYCNNNQLTSLEGAPEVVEGDFVCSNNPNLPKEEIEKYHKTGAVKGNIVSDYGTYEPIN
jgi:hypothetical protein